MSEPSITKKDQERCISRIRKLLALASSSNQNEARIARARATALMEKYAISQGMLGQAEFGTAELETTTKDTAPWKRTLYSTLGAFFGCATGWYVNHNNKAVFIFYGKAASTAVAVYVADVISRGLAQSWKQHRRDMVERGWAVTPRMKADFYNYFVHGAHRKIHEVFCSMSAKEQAYVAQDLEQAADLVKDIPVARKAREAAPPQHLETARAGYAAGRSQNLNIGLGQSETANAIK